MPANEGAGRRAPQPPELTNHPLAPLNHPLADARYGWYPEHVAADDRAPRPCAGAGLPASPPLGRKPALREGSRPVTWAMLSAWRHRLALGSCCWPKA